MRDERQRNTKFFERFRHLLDSMSACCEIVTESGIPSTAPQSPNTKDSLSLQSTSPPVVSNAVVKLCAADRSASPPSAPVLKDRLQLLTTSEPELRRAFSCNDADSTCAPSAAGLYELLLNALRYGGQLELANLLDPGRRLDSAVRLPTKFSRGGVVLHVRVPELLIDPNSSAVPESLRCRFSPALRPGKNDYWLDVDSVLNPPDPAASKPPTTELSVAQEKKKKKQRGFFSSLLFCCIPRRRHKLYRSSQLPHESSRPDDVEFVERVCGELYARLAEELRDTLVQHFEQTLKVLVLRLETAAICGNGLSVSVSGVNSAALPLAQPVSNCKPVVNVQQSPSKSARALLSGPKCPDTTSTSAQTQTPGGPLIAGGAALTATLVCTQREAAQCLVDAVSSGRLALAVERILAPVFSHSHTSAPGGVPSPPADQSLPLSGVLRARIACSIDETSLEEALATLD